MSVIVLAACSSSAKEDLVEKADAKCQTITERFQLSGDLGLTDQSTNRIRERQALVTDLRDSVKAMPAPESGQAELNMWLDQLGKYIEAMTELMNLKADARMGKDLVIMMQFGIQKQASDALMAPAQQFGFDSCAHTENWEQLP
ncbi:hypothetical protein ACFVMC_25715 [Nocardia sp. NPDC127579]|uniref:hypothetical protein n=1 Tax=Nocardia sp. NPDC127579 TaxID=3345402 RepID=UPI003644CA35